MAKRQFKAESKRLLDLMINSIYTHKEIFLREIISNASDAIDKRCYLSLTDDSVGMSREDFRIFISVDEENRKITVSDNGVGMSREELEKNLGVIAKSGSLDFKSAMEADKAAEVDIIGQFGVGFYSAFMVSDLVTVVTRAQGSDTAWCWQSAGADGYTVSECEKETVGTDVIMQLKADGAEERYGDYLQAGELRRLIKKYSDYVRWPIVMAVTEEEPFETQESGEDGEPKIEYRTVTAEKTINSQVPIWQRSRTEVTDEDCKAFYKEKFHDFTDPVSVIRVNAEGLVSYKALLFIPERPPFDYYTSGFEPGLQLYSSGVMIMEKCADLLPDCFRFVRGVVDSPDLSLNISRELLQHDRQLRVIAANLEKRIKAELKKLMDENRETYERFYAGFGAQLKYGVVADYGAKKDLISELLLFYSDKKSGLSSFKEYVDAMPEDQKLIYYAWGDSIRHAQSLPQTEEVRARGFDIFCLTEDVDTFVFQTMMQFGDKLFCNVARDDLGLATEEEKSEIRKKEEEYKDLLAFVKESLEGAVSAVRLSAKLRSHPVCLGTEGGITLEMERYFQSLPGSDAKGMRAQRVLELNGDHEAFRALAEAHKEEPEKARKLARILYAQASLIAGQPLEDPSEYTELVCSLF